MYIYNYYFAVFVLALIFFLISNLNVSVLISIIIIIGIGYYYYIHIDNYDKSLITNFNNKVALLTTDIKERQVFNDPNYFLNKFPVVLRYLRNDKYLIDLIYNIRFLRVFDDAKYTSLIASIEKLMKLYIFMLGDRYDIKIYFSTFLELRATILKEFYSIYIIVPDKFIYIFKVNPYKEVKKTIENFMSHSRKMIIILENYARKSKGIKYLEDTKYRPYDNNNKEVF
jgi:hypothetical protein